MCDRGLGYISAGGAAVHMGLQGWCLDSNSGQPWALGGKAKYT